MSLNERTGIRDLTLNRAHRLYLPPEAHATDLDLVGLCYRCGRVHYILDGKAMTPQTQHTRAIQHIAGRLDAPAFFIFYDRADPCGCTAPDAIDPACDHSLPTVVVWQVWPQPEKDTIRLTGRALFDMLSELRVHDCRR